MNAFLPALFLPSLLLLACALVSSCGSEREDLSPIPATGGAMLRAELIAAPLGKEGRLSLSFPAMAPWSLRLRLTNEGSKPIQLRRSSYAVFSFFVLHVTRIGADGKRTPILASRDIYPNDDSKMPALEYVTLKPGSSIERDMSLLVREGYGLETLFQEPVPSSSHYDDLVADGFGEMRNPGRYEVVGVYSTDGWSKILFEGERGRDPLLASYDGPPIETVPLTVEVEP